MNDRPARRRPGALAAFWALVVVVAWAAGISIWAWAFRGASNRFQQAHAYAELIAGPNATLVDMEPVATAVWQITIAEPSGAKACWIVDANRFQIHSGRVFDGAGRVRC